MKDKRGTLPSINLSPGSPTASLSAHEVIAAILKRLAHRNPNVQLYALSLAESLQKNVGIEVNREIASKAFTQGLEKIITDRASLPRP